MDQQTRYDSSRLTTVAGAMLGISALLLLRRYQGIHHDSILYLGQGLKERWPDIYGQDLFFLHGSQTSYSIVPWVLKLAFGWFTPATTFLWGSLGSLLLFATASWYCLHALLPPKQRYWAWLGILCLPPIYGVVHIFSFNEPFLTSRPFAESFCLFGIGLLARKHYKAALACLLLAAALHPLQAIGASFVIWAWAVLQDRRWLHVAWITLPVAALAYFGIQPFNGLFQQADAAWLTEIEYSRHLFVTLWDINDFKVMGLDVFVLSSAWRMLRNQFGAWCLSSLIGLILGISASLILVDFLHLVLPIGMQLWRAHWLAHWFSMAALAVLLLEHVRTKETIPALLLTLTALLGWGETSWGWALVAMMYLLWPQLPDASRTNLKRLLTFIFSLAIFFLFFSHASNEFHWFREAHYQLKQYPFDRRILAFPVVAFGLPLLGTYLWGRFSPTGRHLLFLLVLCPLALLSASIWDSRHDMQRAFEKTQFQPGIFGIELPQHATIYWTSGSLVGIWLTLQHVSYYSDSQLSGQMFNRDTYTDGFVRQQRMLPLAIDEQRCSAEMKKKKGSVDTRCQVSDSSMRKACEPGANVGPDYIILPFKQPQHHDGIWLMRDSESNRQIATFWLYKCTSVMEDLDRKKS